MHGALHPLVLVRYICWVQVVVLSKVLAWPDVNTGYQDLGNVEVGLTFPFTECRYIQGTQIALGPKVNITFLQGDQWMLSLPYHVHH